MNWIRREARLIVCALQFLTRLPVPALADWEERWSEAWLARSARWFPLVGIIVGLLAAGVLVAAHLVWRGGALPALLAVAVGVLVTGAFHEDGLADAVDGLFGGDTGERRLEIMKDSRIGTFGALALMLGLALKTMALAQIFPPLAAAAALVAAHAGGRAAAVVVMARAPYAADPGASKLKPTARGVRGWEAAFALVLGAMPLLLLSPSAALAGTVVGAFAAACPAVAAWRRVGGWTGDVLGAVEQAFEIGFLLGVAGAVRF